MAEETDAVAAADGAQELREELENQLPNMQFIFRLVRPSFIDYPGKPART
jgi:hypothetical protein